jgi:hypothetical protein
MEAETLDNIIQITATSTEKYDKLFALCKDGSVWVKTFSLQSDGRFWKQVEKGKSK